MATFTDLLSMSADTAERPKPMPVGTYSGIVIGRDFGKTKEKNTDFVSFKIRPVLAHDDVDSDLLAQCKNWNEREMKMDFFITQDALYRLREFLEACGLNTAGRSFSELIEEAVNCEIAFHVGHTPKKDDPTIIYANIDKVVKKAA